MKAPVVSRGEASVGGLEDSLRICEGGVPWLCTCNRGLGTPPPVGSRGRAPGQEVTQVRGAKPP